LRRRRRRRRRRRSMRWRTGHELDVFVVVVVFRSATSWLRRHEQLQSRRLL
jgi:hypothetical protein